MTSIIENVKNKAKSKTRTQEHKICKELKADPYADDFVCKESKAKVGFACSPGPKIL